MIDTCPDKANRPALSGLASNDALFLERHDVFGGTLHANAKLPTDLGQGGWQPTANLGTDERINRGLAVGENRRKSFGFNAYLAFFGRIAQDASGCWISGTIASGVDCLLVACGGASWLAWS